MANTVKGEVGFDVDGEHYTMVLRSNELVELEDRTKIPTGKFFNREEDAWGMRDLRAVFHCSLIRHHGLSEAEAGDLMDRVGLDKVATLIKQAVASAFPESGKRDERPTKTTSRQSGDGERS